MILKGTVEGDIHKNYRFKDLLGRGSFSTVRRGECRHTSEVVAIKIINKNDINALHLDRLQNELSILRTVEGCNEVISVLEAYEDEQNIYIVFEHVDGSNLQEIVVDTVPYPERQAARILKSILYGVSYCHGHGVVHRDMKPENLLISYDMNEIKLADFGLASYLSTGSTLQGSVVGTRAYLSPEVILRQPYGFPVDMWSIGCIAYVLIGGYHPFSDNLEGGGTSSFPSLYTQIVTGDWSFEEEAWKNISEMAKDFISQLLVIDPAQRMTANEALRHPFIRQNHHNDNNANFLIAQE